MMSWEKMAVVAGGLVAVAALVALVWPLARHRLIYPGGTLSPHSAAPALHGLPRSEEAWLQAADSVRIHAWWTPARSDDDASRPAGAVIYFHGNAETLATRAWIADRLADRGYHVLLFDYRGYGLSEGRASEEGLARDARAAWRHVMEDRGVAPDRVILMGHSLGSAVATRLALELQDDDGSGPRTTATRREPTAGTESTAGKGPAALVVGSPFPDMPSLFRHHAPWLPGWALPRRRNTHAAGSRLGEADTPLLAIIGTRDSVIPPELSRRVYDAARAPGTPATVVTVAADHGTVMGHPDVWAAIDAFLGELPGIGRLPH